MENIDFVNNTGQSGWVIDEAFKSLKATGELPVELDDLLTFEVIKNQNGTNRYILNMIED